MAITKIYTLEDPITNEVRYIGMSKNPRLRLNQHVFESRNNKKTDKHKWIRSLLVMDLKPIVNVIDECCSSKAESLEIYYISLFRSQGFNITNCTDGGIGGLGRPMSESQKKILSKVLKGNKFAAGATHKRKKISAFINGCHREFDSVSHAAIELNLGRRAISNNINGWSKECSGIKFQSV